ncbi:hypothetical protein [Saccharopolyspora sp. 5N708]|uniref:hypothetical protein n=1 Tax=Saccharopolyspora sp. 5N708 TaxID=3457424 RepID=UPI003FCFAB88
MTRDFHEPVLPVQAAVAQGIASTRTQARRGTPTIGGLRRGPSGGMDRYGQRCPGAGSGGSSRAVPEHSPG